MMVLTISTIPTFAQTQDARNIKLAIPETSYELGTSIRNDGLRHTMQTRDAKNIQLDILFSLVAGVHWNEVSGLGKLVDDYPDGVKLVAGGR
jgi:hypothetical protein